MLLSFALWTPFVSGEDDLDRKVAPSDTIFVEVFGDKDLTVERRVQAGGAITYPLLGTVEVAGKTTAEVAVILTQLLGKDLLVNPIVSVNVKEYRMRTVSVLGSVAKSGTVKLPIEQKMDIIEAIAEAGGFNREANRNRIELNRNGKTRTLKYDQLRKETDPAKKIWVEPGDVITVRESFL